MPTKKVSLQNAAPAANVTFFVTRLSGKTQNALKNEGVLLYDLVKEFSERGVHTKPVLTPKSKFNPSGILFTSGENTAFLNTSKNLHDSGFNFGFSRQEIAETYESIKNSLRVRLTESREKHNVRFTLCNDGEDLL